MRSYLGFILRYKAVLLFGFLAVFWGNLGQSFLVGWYGDEIKSELSLSAQHYGFIYSAATLASAGLLIWRGSDLDRYATKAIVLVAAVGLFLSCILFSKVAGVASLFAAFFGLRFFGQALLPLLATTTMVKVFERDRGKAISLATSAVSIGEVLLPLAATAMIVLLGWRVSWLVFAASIPLLFAPLVLRSLRRPWHKSLHISASTDTAALGSAERHTGRSILFSDYRYWLALPTAISVPFMLTAIFIHQDFLLLQKHWSLSWMASCFVIYGCFHWLSSMVSGVLVDKYGGVRLFRICTLPLIAALLLVANVSGQWVAAVMMALLAIPIGALGPVTAAMYAEVYGVSHQGGIRATAGSMSILSTAVAPVFLGWLIDAGYSVTLIFNTLAIVFLVGILLLKFSYQTEPHGH